jgi:alkylhydroperoxidase family enzyme
MTPRLRPVQIPEDEAHDVSVALRTAQGAFGIENESPTNFLKTLVRHPPAVAGLVPLVRYITRQSSIPPFDQRLLGLRIAWLCQSQVIWAEQTAAARAVGLGDLEFKRLAHGPGAEWDGQGSAVLRAADEIYSQSCVTDVTWTALEAGYSTRQIVDIIFTVAEYLMLAMLANSFAIQPDARFTDASVPVTALGRRGRPERGRPWRLTVARLDPVPPEDRTPDQCALLDPGGTGQPAINLFATLVRFPDLYQARAAQSTYIRTASTLSGRVREMLILRMGWLCESEYEWAQHAPIARQEGLSIDQIRNITLGPNAPAWSRLDSALLRASDELFRDDTISDATWTTLAGSYTEPQLIDVVITVAGYRLVSVVLNSIGVQIEPDTKGWAQYLVSDQARPYSP